MTSRNPWLDIPAADYLGHMSSPEVDQLAVLGRLFGEALARFAPADVLLLGCATGNGLAHVDPAVTRRVTGIDINPEYLARLREQWPAPAFDLRLECADVMNRSFEPLAYDLVHCALLFEYVDWPLLLPAIGAAIRQDGVLSVVLQRPSATIPAVTRTPFASLLGLEHVFHGVDPSALADRAHRAGLDLLDRRIEPLRSGKSFDVLYFGKVVRSASIPGAQA